MDVLYHGSNVTDLDMLRPSPHSLVNDQPVVFAASDTRFALAMIYGTSEDLSIGYVVDKTTYTEEMCIEELRPGKLFLLQAPGVIYEVSGKDFSSDPRLSHVEYISTNEIPVIKEVYIEDILDELKKDSSIKITSYS